MQYQSSAKKELTINNRKFEYFDLNSIDNELVKTLPYSLKILLENLLRHEDGINVTREDILTIANCDPNQKPEKEISFIT